MGRNWPPGKEGPCCRCGTFAVLDGWARCQRCYDYDVNHPVKRPRPKMSDEERRAKRPEWSRRYYLKHKNILIAKKIAWHRLNRLEHPELLIKDRDRNRLYREQHRKVCQDCGGPCNFDAKRCRSCYYKLLRSRANPWRIHALMLPNSPPRFESVGMGT